MKKQDLLWKGIIRELFPWFVQYFFENWQQEIDLDRGFEFLDKELEQILPDSQAKGRRADVLVKVFSPQGKEFWFLVHVEVQGYHDEDFALRMYTIQYRLFDRYQKPVAALAIFTDSQPDFHPQNFGYQCLTTRLDYQFGTYKLLDHPPGTEISKNENPFSLVMEAAWHGLTRGKLNDEELMEMKISLFRKLMESGFPKETIRGIFSFIKYYVSFDKKEFYHKGFYSLKIADLFRENEEFKVSNFIRRIFGFYNFMKFQISKMSPKIGLKNLKCVFKAFKRL